MNLDKEINKTSWIKKKKKQSIKKSTNNMQNPIPSNLSVAPLQSIFNLNETNKSEDLPQLPVETSYSDNFLRFFSFMPNKITKSVEGFESYNDFSNQIQPYINYFAKWGFDKWWIEYPTTFINWICQEIYKVETIDSNMNPDDLVIITTQFKNLLAIIISIFIAYNWYNVMIELPEKGVELDKISPQDISDVFLPLGIILYYFIVPVYLFQLFIINFTELLKYFKSYGFSFIVFLLLFGIIIFTVINYGASIVQSFSDYIHGGQGPYIKTFSLIIVAYGLITIPLSFMTAQKYMSNPLSLLWSSERKTLNHAISNITYATSITASILLIVPAFFMFLIRATLTIKYMWLVGIFAVGYILFKSFFGLFDFSIFYPSKFSIGNFSDVSFITYMYDTFNLYNKMETINNKICETISSDEYNVWKYVYKHKFQFILIIYLLISAVKYGIYINSDILKSTLIILIIFCIMGILYTFKDVRLLIALLQESLQGEKNNEAIVPNPELTVNPNTSTPLPIPNEFIPKMPSAPPLDALSNTDIYFTPPPPGPLLPVSDIDSTQPLPVSDIKSTPIVELTEM